MFQTNTYSQILLRLSLAAVFLWFGIGKCIQSEFWVQTWLPERTQHFVSAIGMSPVNFIILIGILEVCIAASLVTGFFQRWFATAGAIFLIVVMSAHGITEVLVRDIGLVGALAALAVWPERRYS